MRPPMNQKGVKEFLGMVGYYRKFISRFADAARPMTKLTRKVKEMPIAYLSAQLSNTQFKLSTNVKEGYAIYYAIKKWRHYLDDADILLKSDAKSLENFCMAELITTN